MLFIHAHMKGPITNVLRVAVESVMFGKAIDDAGHPLACRPLQAKSLTSKQLQPTSLVHQKSAPGEKRLRLRRRLDTVQLFLSKPACLRRRRFSTGANF